jgi:hypothetical protein
MHEQFVSRLTHKQYKQYEVLLLSCIAYISVLSLLSCNMRCCYCLACALLRLLPRLAIVSQFGLAYVVGGVVLKVLFAPPYVVTVIQAI